MTSHQLTKSGSFKTRIWCSRKQVRAKQLHHDASLLLTTKD